jgi:hypothetical protein
MPVTCRSSCTRSSITCHRTFVGLETTGSLNCQLSFIHNSVVLDCNATGLQPTLLSTEVVLATFFAPSPLQSRCSARVKFRPLNQPAIPVLYVRKGLSPSCWYSRSQSETSMSKRTDRGRMVSSAAKYRYMHWFCIAPNSLVFT